MERVGKKGHGAHDMEEISAEARGREMLLMGLRLIEGVDLAAFQNQAGCSFSDFVKAPRVKMLEEEGLIRQEPGRLMATPKGRQRLNAVLAYLLAG